MQYELSIDYWTDFVGTFDPLKVVGLVKRAFPGTVVDPTDHQAVELERFLSRIEAVPEPQRATMTRQARRKAMDNGPRFHFEIPLEGASIQGHVGRYWLSLDVPDAISDKLRDSLETFLKGLKLGEPTFTAD